MIYAYFLKDDGQTITVKKVRKLNNANQFEYNKNTYKILHSYIRYGNLWNLWKIKRYAYFNYGNPLSIDIQSPDTPINFTELQKLLHNGITREWLGTKNIDLTMLIVIGIMTMAIGFLLGYLIHGVPIK